MNLPLFKIYWDEKDIDYVNKKIISGQYWCTGEENEILENKICEYLDMPYCISLNSGGSALHALMIAYDIGPGDEVIVPSFTFIATAYSPLYTGGTPRFADIEDSQYGLDPDSVNEAITSKTKAILPIHFAGTPFCHATLPGSPAGRRETRFPAQPAIQKQDPEYAGTPGPYPFRAQQDTPDSRHPENPLP